MCGRFTLHTEKEVIAARFGVSLDLAALDPRYNIAPTQDVLVVRARPAGREAALVRWGLIPYWAKDPAQLPLMINARVETAAQKPAYRDALRYRRCLIPADGFYEWRGGGDRRARKTPYFITVETPGPYAMAGVLERWRPRDAPESDPRVSCAILTGPAHTGISHIHPRMPLILRPEHEGAWLDPDLDEASAALALLDPPPPELFRSHPISELVNSVEHDGPALIAPALERQLSLL